MEVSGEQNRITIVRDPITVTRVRGLADLWYGTLLKGVADVRRGVIALGGEWHMDANVVLLGDGSKQEDVWGFNIYPDEQGDNALEYVSLINIRPAQGNTSMEIQDEAIRRDVRRVVGAMIPDLNL